MFCFLIALLTVVHGDAAHRADRFLTNLSGFGYSGVMLVVKDDKVILRKGYGLANDAAKIPVTPDTVFDIGSLAKQFTAAAVLRLEMQGKLQISDPIGKYLPDVPKDKSAITVEQLLSHSAGLDSDFPVPDPFADPPYEDVDRAHAVRRILDMPLIGEPGKAYSYSNPGYVLLAAIVETASGQPFRDFVRTHLFEPAGMHDTGFWGSGMPKVGDARIAHGYNETGEIADPRKLSATTWFDLGGGEVVSTAGDLYKWFLALQGDAILSAAARQKMFTPRLSNYGLGWWIQRTPRGTTVIQHGGDYAGFGSQFSWFRDENVLMIGLANRSNQIFGTRHVADRLVPQFIFGAKELHMYTGDAFELPPASTPIAPAVARKLAGTYRLSTGGRLTIQERNGGLEIGAEGQDAVDALAYASDAEMQRRARLTERARIMLAAATSGDSSAVQADWLSQGKTVVQHMKVLQSIIRDDEKTNGAFRSVEIAGTVPGAFPVGVLHTKVRLIFEKGTDEFQYNWIDERMSGTRSTPALLALTPLRAGRDANHLLGWSIIWFKGFTIKWEGAGESLVIEHEGRSTRAQRLAGN